MNYFSSLVCEYVFCHTLNSNFKLKTSGQASLTLSLWHMLVIFSASMERFSFSQIYKYFYKKEILWKPAKHVKCNSWVFLSQSRKTVIAKAGKLWLKIFFYILYIKVLKTYLHYINLFMIKKFYEKLYLGVSIFLLFLWGKKVKKSCKWQG
jgi:hypothetical protein